MSPSAASFRPLGLALVANGVLGIALVTIALATLGPLLARASAAADSAGESLTAAAQAHAYAKTLPAKEKKANAKKKR